MNKIHSANEIETGFLVCMRNSSFNGILPLPWRNPCVVVDFNGQKIITDGLRHISVKSLDENFEFEGNLIDVIYGPANDIYQVYDNSEQGREVLWTRKEFYATMENIRSRTNFKIINRRTGETEVVVMTVGGVKTCFVRIENGNFTKTEKIPVVYNKSIAAIKRI